MHSTMQRTVDDYVTSPAPAPRRLDRVVWAGRVLSALPVLGLLFSGAMKLLKPPAFVKSFTDLGYPERLARGIGVLEVACVVVYVIPQTAVLGAILITGYLGGAVATHVRMEEPSKAIAPAVLGAVAWLGVLLRDRRLRPVLPFRV